MIRSNTIEYVHQKLEFYTGIKFFYLGVIFLAINFKRGILNVFGRSNTIQMKQSYFFNLLRSFSTVSSLLLKFLSSSTSFTTFLLTSIISLVSSLTCSASSFA